MYKRQFPNISLPKDSFLSALATMRSRGIFCSIIAQNMAQLKAMYKNDWESLVGLCDEFLYLGGNEQGTHKYVSELIGKETISIASYNRSRGRNGSYSVNRQTSGRELLKPDEVRLLGDDKAILFVRGERPILDDKYDLLRHPNIRFTEDGGADVYKRQTIPTSAIFTTILCVTSCCAAQCWWCAVATATRLSTHSSAWRKNTAEFVQPWMGSLRLRPEANRLSAELSTSSQPVNGFASIAFGSPNAHFGAVPQTPLRTDGGEQRLSLIHIWWPAPRTRHGRRGQRQGRGLGRYRQ